ncbi:DEAD/DEAH box helicase [Pelagicoccus albus]|uniref:DEAD/DEAH box helicase n=1 Tax=Pelagicoccus albus TaxID=415222 RepID=A0A7X1E9K9_9BACT|nr:DEAD/DEAH box helicase [Pelagicoccus albus]MBC2605887.1 DEAD/DEAH box helicase [Pelagicoccus albus]
MPVSRSSVLKSFHPSLAKWFLGRFGQPTEIQEAAWSLISHERHCLISAATGSGKTLAAFLWGINQLATGTWELGQTRLLYVSPLKALNNDIRRNLLTPLSELKSAFADSEQDWPDIRVMARSGDTDQSERRKMLRHPPEILITTPESLNLLLSSKSGRRALLGIKSVILDEIHSVAGSKRGTYLMTGVERLAHLNGEFQRIALSATVRPMEEVARFVGGFLEGQGREVQLAQSAVGKRYEIEIVTTDPDAERNPAEDAWQPVVEDLKRLIAQNNSTLIFVNSRMLAEKIAHRINLGEDTQIAYSHHGSLSREIRFTVEQRLKSGEVKAIVATSSLEMGIDVGSIDCVVMVQSPNSVSSSVQKVGRSGHQVGAVSRATLYPSHSKDLLESVVLSKSIREKDIENVKIVECPLDVLAQVIVSTLACGPWDLDELFELFRSCYSFRKLDREVFDLVTAMLAGRYAGSRLRELKPQISIDMKGNAATLRKGALLSYYMSGGVIPDRGYYHLRMSGTGSRIGELDEEFVWERKVGDVFTLGVQSWRIENVTHNDVFVLPAQKGEMAPPFWRAETYDRDFHLSNRIGEFLEWAEGERSADEFLKQLSARYGIEGDAAKSLNSFLERQRKATGAGLPHRHHLLAELIDSAPGGAPGKQLVLHTFWGGRVNRPFSLALDAAWQDAFGNRADVFVNDDCVVIVLPDEVDPERVLDLVSPNNLEKLLRQSLEGSNFFGARFREAAGTSLLITRNKPGQRLPLWMSRMRAKKLMDSVRSFDDFPLLLETWRSCLNDDFDMESLRLVLEELECGEISVSVARTSLASPFAADVAWRQINEQYMYATDQPDGAGESKLRDDLIRSVMFDDGVRPLLSRDLVNEFESKRQRTRDGYSPVERTELLEWLRDRILLEESEWSELLHGYSEEVIPVERKRLESGVFVYLQGEEGRVAALLADAPDRSVFLEWLSFYGPVSEEWLRDSLGLSGGEEFESLVAELVDDELVVRGMLVEGEENEQICEIQNYEILLRMNRARNRSVFEALPLEALSLFLADWQGAARPSENAEGLVSVLDKLSGLSAGAAEWEGQILRSRLLGYHESHLDRCLMDEGFLWVGTGERQLSFIREEELDLLPEIGAEYTPLEKSVLELLSKGARYSFSKLQELIGGSSKDLEKALWGLVWSGQIGSDLFSSVRKAEASNFELFQKVEQQSAPSRTLRRGRRSRARLATYPGSWYKNERLSGELDAIESLELERERAFVLLDRYGVLFKELLERECAGFRWKDVFKALRLLELGGEVVGGRFFEGIPGLQFASHEALRRLNKTLPESAIYWLGATDPASLCGIGLENLKGALPRRQVGNRLVYRGRELVAEARRGGKDLEFKVDCSDPDLIRIVDTLGSSLDLQKSLRSIRIETINGKDARQSDYLESLSLVWRLHSDHKQVVVEGRVSP